MGIITKFTLIFALVGGSLWAAGDVRIDGASFDFGQVPDNATVSHRIWIHAGDTDTLILTDIKTGCGCLSAPWSTVKIPPGDSLSLVFYWQTRGSAGDQAQSAYLYLGPNALPHEIVLKGNVVTSASVQASVAWQPSVLVLSKASDSALSSSFELANTTDEALTVVVTELAPGLTVEVPESIETGQTVVGRIWLDKAEAIPSFEGSVTLDLGGNLSEGYRVSIPVRVGDFSFRPTFTTKKK